MSENGLITIDNVHIYSLNAIPTTGNMANAPSGSIGLLDNGSGIYYFGNGQITGTWNQFVTANSSGVYNIASNDPRINKAKTVVVQKTPGSGEFASVKDAVDFAATQGPSALEPWAVIVYPGYYQEDQINIPSDVHIMGIDQTSCTVATSGTGHTFYANAPFSMSFLSVENTNAGYAGLKCENIDEYGYLHKVSFRGCDVGIDYYVDYNTTNQLYMEYVD